MTPEVTAALALITTSLNGAAAPALAEITAALGGVAAWEHPTADVTAAFATRIGWSVADLLGSRRAVGVPEAPGIGNYNGTEADAKLYAAFSFEPNGFRTFSVVGDRDVARATCVRLRKCTTEAEGEAVVRGAGTKSIDLAIVLVMLGHTSGMGSSNAQIDSPAWQTLAQFLANAPVAPVVGPPPPAPTPGGYPGL
jgi:hypothetical protein